MINTFKFVEVTFNIETVYSYFHVFAKDYICKKKAMKTVSINNEDINLWIKKHKVNTKLYSLDYIETLVIHSKLADILSSYNTFIFHGSAIYVDNKDNAYIFTAPTRVGKSTHVNLLMKNYPNRIHYINDDKPFISLENNQIYVHGSPFDGKERKSNNVKCKLKRIFILSRAKENSVKQINSKDALEVISNQLHFPKDREKAFKFLFKLMDLVKFYDLKINMLDDAAKTSFKIMTGK